MKRITNEEFDEYLNTMVSKMTAAQILSYGDVYTTLAEALNNEVIDSWERSTIKERMAEAEKLGETAGLHDATHDCKTANPYGMDTESACFETWESAYENAYEANLK